MCSTTITRMCKVLPKVVTKLRRAAMLVELQHNIWGWPGLDGSRRRLYTSQEEEKHIPCSGKTLAETKKEQCWRYDPTIKYEALRRYAVPRYTYESTYWSDSSDCEIENVYMAGTEAYVAEKAAQIEKDKIRAVIEEEQLIGTEEEQLIGTEEEQEQFLFSHDPSIVYKPLRRYVVPRFAFSDTSSTDWSDSTDSESEAMIEEATQIKKENFPAGTRVEDLYCNDLGKSPSTDFQPVVEDLTKTSLTNLQSESVVQDLSFLVEHGDKSLAESGAKDSEQAKDMYSTGVEKVINDNQNKGGECLIQGRWWT